LFIQDFLIVDPDLSFSDPEGVLAVLENALAEQRLLQPQADGDLTAVLAADPNSFRDISEQTSAVYAQANFETGIFRGNLGFRFVTTDVAATSFGPVADANGVRPLVTNTGSYNFTLPRFNLVATPTDNFVIRFGYAEDILRPNFSSLSAGFTFNTSENGAVNFGNPSLVPETVDSLDLSFEWYFAPASVISIGFFDKDRTNLFVTDFEGALLVDGPTASGFETVGGLSRETDPTCPGGGVFNPEVIPNVLGDPDQLGLCVDFSTPGNDPATTSQRGIEVAFQGDLSSFEDRLGWASGFGLVANYTYQVFSGGSNIDTASGRGEQVLGEGASIPEGLLDFSNNAFNITPYYEKYGLTVRARYTWRDEFRTNDFGGGANTSGSSTFGFPVVTEARGQLNASISYDVTDRLTIGAEGINLTTSNIVQRCVTADGPVCFVGFPDRRITFGATYTF